MSYLLQTVKVTNKEANTQAMLVELLKGSTTYEVGNTGPDLGQAYTDICRGFMFFV